MTAIEVINQLISTVDLASQQVELLQRVLTGLNSPKREKIKPEMPTFDKRRREFHQLMPAHLLFVEEIGLWEYYNREETHAWMLTNYAELFPSLRRRKADAVPSDQGRRERMIDRLLDLVEVRRSEISNRERASVRHVKPTYKYEGLTR